MSPPGASKNPSSDTDNMTTNRLTVPTLSRAVGWGQGRQDAWLC